jgi:hypothetical protein
VTTTENAIKTFVASIEHPYLLLLLDRLTKDRLEEVGVSKSKVNPVGEYAEYLVALALDGKRMPNAKEGHDITLKDGSRIEVKGRIFEGKRVPLSDVRHSIIENETFDYLVYVVFSEDMTIKYGLKIPFVQFLHLANFSEPRNGAPKWRFHASPKLLSDPRVTDITDALRKVQNLRSGLNLSPVSC